MEWAESDQLRVKLETRRVRGCYADLKVELKQAKQKLKQLELTIERLVLEQLELERLELKARQDNRPAKPGMKRGMNRGATTGT